MIYLIYSLSYHFLGALEADEDRETYQQRVARKQALSNWLAEAAVTRISQEVDAANFQVFLPCYTSGRLGIAS